MGRTNRRKKHTHQVVETEANAPKSFVIERGKVGTTLHHLVLDLRRVMEPNTATKLKVRHKNVLKDFIQVAGPLGCTHMIILSKTESYINLRVCKLPRGPTVTFHVKAFTLCHEVLASLKKPAINPKQFLTPALLVLNNFTAESKPLELMTSLFQNMFPTVNIHKVKLSEIRRCVLLNYISDTNSIEFRHYNIKATPRGMSRGVKKLIHSHVPNLGKYTDISDLVLGGNLSESEGEELAEGGEGEVTLPQDLPGRGNVKSEQSAIKLTELGPRLTLQLVKVESGLCGGEVLHHEFIQKTKHEVKELKKRVEGQRRLKDMRRSEQEHNIQRKLKEKELHKQKCLAGQKGEEKGGDGTSGEDQDGDGGDSDDDAQWYKQEVGEEPDPELFGSKKRRGSSTRSDDVPFKKFRRDPSAGGRTFRGGGASGRGRTSRGGGAGARFGGRARSNDRGTSSFRGQGHTRGRGQGTSRFGGRRQLEEGAQGFRGRRQSRGGASRGGSHRRGGQDGASEGRSWSTKWKKSDRDEGGSWGTKWKKSDRDEGAERTGDWKPHVRFTKPSHKTRHSVGQKVKVAGGRVFRKKVT